VRPCSCSAWGRRGLVFPARQRRAYAEGQEGTRTAARRKKDEHPPEYLAVEPFTVNLQPENGDQYLQLAFTLQVDGAEQAEVIKTNMAKVRSRVLLLLSSKKASEINTVEGKQQLSRGNHGRGEAALRRRHAEQEVRTSCSPPSSFSKESWPIIFSHRKKSMPS
jgi:flagellar basal body-associated protein FliL